MFLLPQSGFALAKETSGLLCIWWGVGGGFEVEGRWRTFSVKMRSVLDGEWAREMREKAIELDASFVDIVTI